MEWMLLPLKRYAQFSGRARPKEFWMFFLFMIIGVFVLSFVDAALGFGTSERWAEQGSWGGAAGFHNSGGLLTTLFVLAIIIPYLAVAVRRLHDTDRSRSEEHTSELQSLMRSSYADFCLKKKNETYNMKNTQLHTHN